MELLSIVLVCYWLSLMLSRFNKVAENSSHLMYKYVAAKHIQRYNVHARYKDTL